MSRIPIGLIGVGGFGAAHVAELEALEAAGITRLVAAADFRGGPLAESAARLERRGVRWHEDYHSLLAGKDLQAVIICTPIPLHKEMALAAIERGIHVYLEKPPVPLLRDLRELIAADARRRVAVGFTAINSPIVKKAKQKILEGMIGQLTHLRLAGLWPRTDQYYSRSKWAGRLSIEGKPTFDGPVTNAMSHYVHAMAYLAGGTFPGYDRAIQVTGELYRGRPIDSYDLACFSGKFASGPQFSAALGHTSSQCHEVTLRALGTEGHLDIVFGRTTGISCSFEATAPASENPLHGALLDFISSIHSGQKPDTTLEDSISYAELTNAMAISSGRIHDIPREFLTFHSQGPSRTIHLDGIGEAARETFEQGSLFSEQARPWAMKATPKAVPIAGLPDLDPEKLAAPAVPSRQGAHSRRHPSLSEPVGGVASIPSAAEG